MKVTNLYYEVKSGADNEQIFFNEEDACRFARSNENGLMDVYQITYSYNPEELPVRLFKETTEKIDANMVLSHKEKAKHIKAKELKSFMTRIPDSAEVIFSDDIITFLFNGSVFALNKYGGEWCDGVGYAPGGTTRCGECSHFDCSKCR